MGTCSWKAKIRKVIILMYNFSEIESCSVIVFKHIPGKAKKSEFLHHFQKAASWPFLMYPNNQRKFKSWDTINMRGIFIHHQHYVSREAYWGLFAVAISLCIRKCFLGIQSQRRLHAQPTSRVKISPEPTRRTWWRLIVPENECESHQFERRIHFVFSSSSSDHDFGGDVSTT